MKKLLFITILLLIVILCAYAVLANDDYQGYQGYQRKVLDRPGSHIERANAENMRRLEKMQEESRQRQFQQELLQKLEEIERSIKKR